MSTLRRYHVNLSLNQLVSYLPDRWKVRRTLLEHYEHHPFSRWRDVRSSLLPIVETEPFEVGVADEVYHASRLRVLLILGVTLLSIGAHPVVMQRSPDFHDLGFRLEGLQSVALQIDCALRDDDYSMLFVFAYVVHLVPEL